jgi:hypothetical protein
MLAINDLNVSLDLDKSALAAVSGAGTHYSSWYYSSWSSASAWKKTQSYTLINSNVYKHGVRHNMYKTVWKRTKTQSARRYKYVG